jgi:hypothetical protein
MVPAASALRRKGTLRVNGTPLTSRTATNKPASSFRRGRALQPFPSKPRSAGGCAGTPPTAQRGPEVQPRRPKPSAWLSRAAHTRVFLKEPRRDPPARHLGETASRKSLDIGEAVRTVAKCETCGKPLPYRGTGRPRKFCDAGCYALARNRRRPRVPMFVYDPALKRTVPNPRSAAEVEPAGDLALR